MKKGMLLKSSLGLAVLLGSTMSAQAAYISFYLDSNSRITASTSGVGNYIEYTDSSGFKVTATAFYTSDPGTTALSKAAVNRYSGGLGVCEGSSCGSPNHAVDNNHGKDFLLLSFSGYADPYSITVGWASGDADVQYWVGSKKNPALNGLLVSNLGSQGFTTYYIDENSNTRTFNVDGGSGFALLISGQLDEYNDYFKVKKLKLEPTERTETPEPATLGLVGFALVGLAVARRKRA